MGFYYRKSVNLGPFRVNFSKSGVGYSVGGPGFRKGVSASGKKYTTFGIPGTGMGYRTTSANKAGNGCLLVAIALFGLATIIVSLFL